MHGPTFMGNPLACAIASANLDLLAHATPRARCAASPGSGRGAGARGIPRRGGGGTGGRAVGVLQLREPVRVAEVTAAALERGVWVRPFRDLVYTMPPYVTSDDELS